jgi:hypothetical protein
MKGTFDSDGVEEDQVLVLDGTVCVNDGHKSHTFYETVDGLVVVGKAVSQVNPRRAVFSIAGADGTIAFATCSGNTPTFQLATTITGREAMRVPPNPTTGHSCICLCGTRYGVGILSCACSSEMGPVVKDAGSMVPYVHWLDGKWTHRAVGRYNGGYILVVLCASKAQYYPIRQNGNHVVLAVGHPVRLRVGTNRIGPGPIALTSTYISCCHARPYSNTLVLCSVPLDGSNPRQTQYIRAGPVTASGTSVDFVRASLYRGLSRRAVMPRGRELMSTFGPVARLVDVRTSETIASHRVLNGIYVGALGGRAVFKRNKTTYVVHNFNRLPMLRICTSRKHAEKGEWSRYVVKFFNGRSALHLRDKQSNAGRPTTRRYLFTALLCGATSTPLPTELWQHCILPCLMVDDTMQVVQQHGFY